MNYRLEFATRARKQLAQLPQRDRERILTALRQMQEDPFSGDIKHLTNQPFAWRQRVGPFRILYDLNPTHHVIIVARIERRSTTTYR